MVEYYFTEENVKDHQKKTTTYKLGIKPEAKRDLIYDDKGLWVDTSPIHVELDDDTALGDGKSRQIVQALMDNINDLMDQINKLNRKLLDIKEEREMTKQEEGREITNKGSRMTKVEKERDIPMQEF
ncbi:uncharacterized protein LOC132639663 [Lycium barbarum]|uniref:uncharacterized protein LOC132639663 n=1 Tax=Lycium barbarum TaxID=112863 RepID=UPI00293F1557|nr:uncharacterized protein LOC132639663 [Lycium barbarum]